MMKKDTKTWIIALLAIFVILLVGVFLIEPATTGYAIYKKMSKANGSLEDYEEGVNEMKEKVNTVSTNLSSCKTFNDKVLTRIENMSGKFSLCKENLKQCKLALEEQKSNLTEKYKEREENLTQKYEKIIANLANRICCKAKVDNPDIEYYKIEDDNVVCTGEGENKIDCNF